MSKYLRVFAVAALAATLILSAFAPALAQEGGNLFLPFLRTDAGEPSIVAADTGTLVAGDMLCSEHQNLSAYVNPWTDAFGSDGDGFQKYQRGVSPSIPFAVLDDSLSIFPGDSLGIIREGNIHEFFGVADTQNDDNSVPVSASWTFDISGAAAPLYLSIDMGAMGDFELADTFTWSYQIDGGPAQTAFANTVDEDASHDYTLEGGATFTLPDPMLVDGVLLDNNLQTFSTALVGAGSELVLTLTAQTDGGTEAFAFQNIAIGSGGPIEPIDCTPEPPVDITLIHDVQGDGATSPLVGQSVTIEGVVVGDFIDDGTPGSPNLRGFNVQEEDADADGDPLTSEGVFVYMPAANVNVGDVVRVTGVVQEYVTSGSSLTEIAASQYSVEGTAALPAITDVTLPVNAITDFERYEGMYIRFPQALVISEYFNFDRFNEIVLAWPLDGQDRPYQPTSLVSPGAEANALQAVNDLRHITLDDARTAQNLDPALHPNGQAFTLDNRFRGGDIVQNATGVMDESFGLYRIQPTQGADYTPVNPRPETPEDAGGSLRVAAFNVLNYFNGDGQGGGFPTSRGARDLNDFQRQHVKIVKALAALDADIVGLIEIENDAGAYQAVETLLNGSAALGVTGLNALVAPDTYAYIDTGVIGTDEIRQAIIYRAQSVTPVKGYAVLDSSDDPTFIDDKNRPVPAQTFAQLPEGSRFTVAVNHLKSKGSDCNDIGDPDLGDGQGNCNVTRTTAAIALANWLASDPTESGDPDAIVIGDLNAYAMEDPIAALEDAGYTNLVKLYQGALAYSYVFDGQFGYLDHSLANWSLLPQITGATVWHINADEPDILDYTTRFKAPAQQALFEENAFRSSDHDPVVAGIEPWPVCQDVVPSTDVLWPVNHKLVNVNILSVAGISNPAVTILSVYQDEPVNGTGDGDTSPDAAGIGSATAQLRAERAGGGNGRVYHVRFLASGEEGTCEGAALISAPVSRGNGGAAVDDGEIYDSTVASVEDASASAESPYEGSVPNLFLPMLGAE